MTSTLNQDIVTPVASEFEPLDQVFANFMLRYAGCKENSELLYFISHLVSKSVREGHICCDLSEWDDKKVDLTPLGKNDVQLTLPERGNWNETLTQKFKNAVSSYPDCSSGSNPFSTPLVIDKDNRLYLQRYLVYELIVARAILQRLKKDGTEKEHPPKLGKGELKKLFSNYDLTGAEINYQWLAVIAAASRDFCVISGGPGTGKTTVVAALLAIEFSRESKLKVALCAPTGKAKSRLAEALQEDGEKINTSDEIRKKIQNLETFTIHKLLEINPRSHENKYHQKNHLPYDLVIVDESSMVSLSIMASLVQALAPETRLILLGDPFQLAAVEPGAVLADICSMGDVNCFSESIRKTYSEQDPDKQLPQAISSLPLNNSIAELSHNYRSAKAPSIDKISKRIRNIQTSKPDTPDWEGKIEEATDFIYRYSYDYSKGNNPDQRNKDFSVIKMTEENLVKALEAELNRSLVILENDSKTPSEPSHQEELKLPLDKFRKSFMGLADLANNGSEEALDQAFKLLNRFKVLAALRKGPFGVENLNRIIQKEIFKWSSSEQPGMPVMILVNDKIHGLSNGDIGLYWKDISDPQNKNAKTKVYFPGRETSLLPAELPEHEPVFAMTIHKAQGSGFDRVLIVMPPDKESPILTQELLYTAITRAKTEVVLWSSREVTQHTLSTPTHRITGLKTRLAEDNGLLERFKGWPDPDAEGDNQSQTSSQKLPEDA